MRNTINSKPTSGDDDNLSSSLSPSLFRSVADEIAQEFKNTPVFAGPKFAHASSADYSMLRRRYDYRRRKSSKRALIKVPAITQVRPRWKYIDRKYRRKIKGYRIRVKENPIMANHRAKRQAKKMFYDFFAEFEDHVNEKLQNKPISQKRSYSKQRKRGPKAVETKSVAKGLFQATAKHSNSIKEVLRRETTLHRQGVFNSALVADLLKENTHVFRMTPKEGIDSK